MDVRWAVRLVAALGGCLGVILTAAAHDSWREDTPFLEVMPVSPPSTALHTRAAQFPAQSKAPAGTTTVWERGSGQDMEAPSFSPPLSARQRKQGREAQRRDEMRVTRTERGNGSHGELLNLQQRSEEKASLRELRGTMDNDVKAGHHLNKILMTERGNGSYGEYLTLRQLTREKVMFRRLQGRRDEDSKATHALRRMLVAVVRQELHECDLVMMYDGGYSDPAILSDLLLLPNIRQVLEVREGEDLLKTVWASRGCRGYLALLHDPQPLLAFADTHRDAWDYDGRYVVVGTSLPHLLQLTRTDKGRKTQHLVGAVQSGDEEAGEWRLYVNQLYWGRGEMQPATTWRQKAFTSDVNLFPDKLSDLRGAQLRVVTFVWEPSIMYRRKADGSLLERYGVDIDTIALLAHAMNFSVRYDEPNEGELWGRQLDDGSWDGIMGFLDRDEADIGVANMFLSYWRIQVVEFTAPYDLEASCFLARAEPPLPRWQALAFPFHWGTWLAILVGLVVSGPLLHLLTVGESTWGEWWREGETELLGPSWMYTLGLHLREAQARVPQQPGTRVLVAFLWVYTIILTIAYSTNLTAFLLVKKLPATIETIEQLSRSGLKVAGVGELFMTELQEASDPNVKALAKKFEEQPSKQEAYQKVLAGEAMFVENRGYVEFVAKIKYSKGGESRMRVMKECFAPNNIVMAVQRRSPLKAKVDQIIDWIREGGFVRRSFLASLRKASRSKEYINWSVGGNKQETTTEEEERDKTGGLTPLNLDHLQGAFILSLAGLLAASLSFLLEAVWPRLRRV